MLDIRTMLAERFEVNLKRKSVLMYSFDMQSMTFIYRISKFVVQEDIQ